MVLLSSGQSSAEIDEIGAYLNSLTLDGKHILKKSEDGEQTHGGSAVLIPYAGRVRNAKYKFGGSEYSLPRNNGTNSIHGFAKDSKFSITEKEIDSATLSLFKEAKGYPAPLETRIKYALNSDSLTVSVSVSNKGEKGAPLLIGFHPYFVADKGWQLRHSDNLKELNFRDEYFPDGTYEEIDLNSDNKISEKNFDNAFVGGGEISLKRKDCDIIIRRENMNYLVIYNGEYAEGKSVAIEPMTGAPDAFNNGIGLISLGRGGSYTCGFEVHMKPR